MIISLQVYTLVSKKKTPTNGFFYFFNTLNTTDFGAEKRECVCENEREKESGVETPILKGKSATTYNTSKTMYSKSYRMKKDRIREKRIQY